MMVDELGNPEAANLLLDALADVTSSGVLTVDLGGTALHRRSRRGRPHCPQGARILSKSLVAVCGRAYD